jgi:hypothetical protein
MVMTKGESNLRMRHRRIDLPRFNAALGRFLALPPRLDQKYTDVLAQIYPLKAGTAQLQKFCDGYLNLTGDPPNRFEAAIPWVLMQVLDYGKIAASARNVGWFSQRELAFGVPLRWYRKDRGKWAFVDWAMAFPFIYVDSQLSMSGGREIYGWSKAPIKIDVAPAIFQPANERSLVSISLVKGGTNYGERSKDEEFLEIAQQRPFRSVRSAVSDALTAIPRAISSSIAAVSSMFQMGSDVVSNNGDSELQSLQQIVVRLYGPALNMLASGFLDGSARQAPAQNPPIDIITLKQVREVRGRGGACFQAIVDSKMGVERLIDGGALFDPLVGDATGGIQIDLAHNTRQPIVQSLGIVKSQDSRIDGKPASRLRPLLPFWLKMDLTYGVADYQCWRTENTEWTSGDKVTYTKRRKIPYTTMGSGARQEIGGRCEFPRVTFRVMPLRADRRKLQRLITLYLKNDFFEFKLAGQIKDNGRVYAVVCLIGSNFENMAAASDRGTEYSDREIIFAAPVAWWEKGKPQIKHPALIPLYTFAGTTWNAATSYEVYGQFTLKSELGDSKTEWLTDPTRSRRRRQLLTVSTELFPKLGKSQEAQELPVVEVAEAPGKASSVRVPSHLAQLGLGHIWNGGRFDSIALKQIADAEDLMYADYQAIIGLTRRFKLTKRDASGSDALPPLSIKIHEYPTFPFAETLGLVAPRPRQNGQSKVYTLKPIDPFLVSGAMKSEPGRELCWRVERKWRR